MINDEILNLFSCMFYTYFSMCFPTGWYVQRNDLQICSSLGKCSARGGGVMEERAIVWIEKFISLIEKLVTRTEKYLQ